MGNYVTSRETTATAAGGGGGVDEDGKRRRRRWKAPREDQLGMVPGRIFSNDSRSRTASVFGSYTQGELHFPLLRPSIPVTFTFLQVT